MSNPSRSAKPHTVLLVNDKLSMDGVNPNSIAILFGHWIDYMDRSRFTPVVCTLREPDPGGVYLEKKGIRVHYIGLGKYSFRTVTELERVIEREEADIVHLHGYRGSNFGRLAARRRGVRNIVHEHAVLPVPVHQYLMDWFLKSYTDLGVAVSDYVKAHLIRKRHVPAERTTVLWNGIDLDRFAPLPNGQRDVARRGLDITPEIAAVGVVTRLRKEKGTEYLVKAAERVLREMPGKAVFLIAGEGPDRGKIEALIRRLGVGDGVHLLGHRHDVPGFLSLLDILVIPSLTEGFPLALLEGMAAGLPIIATRVGGMPEILVDGKTGIFVEPENPAAIADTVGALIEDRRRADELGRAALDDSRRFGIQASVSALERIYEELIVS